jgi:hypothetical protein
MVANPGVESLVDFGRWGNLVMKEGEAQGLEGETLQAWAMGKRDKLFKDIVTANLDSEDPSKIMQVEGLLDSLPDGVISQTQMQSLAKLVKDKSLDSQARQEAAAYMQDGTLAGGLSEYFKMVKQDPQKAGVYLDQITRLARLRDQVQANERGSLRQRMEADMINSGVYKPSDLKKAEELGLLADMKDYERRYKKGQNEDITSKPGEKIFAEFLSSPSLMRDRFDTWNELYDASRGDISQTDMERLALLWASTAPPEEEPPEILGPRAIRGSKFTDQDRDLLRGLLLKFDQKIEGKGDYLTRLQTKYGGSEQSTITARRAAMQAEWISAVLDKYDELINSPAWIKKHGDPSHEQALQIVAQIVWDGGWKDEAHSVNGFTTEVPELPSTPEDLAQYEQQAISELKMERLAKSYEGVMDIYSLPGMMVTAREFQVDLAQQLLGGSPEGVNMLVQANQQAFLQEATDPVSPAEVLARQQGLYESAQKLTISQDQRNQESAMQSAARDLLNSLNVISAGDVSMHSGTKMDRQMYYKLFGEDTPIGKLFRPTRLRPDEKRAMFLEFHSKENGVIERLQASGMKPKEAQEFVLMFYVGEESELDVRTRKRLRGLPGAEGESRWIKLQRYFAEGQFRASDREERLNMDELFEIGRTGRQN